MALTDEEVLKDLTDQVLARLEMLQADVPSHIQRLARAGSGITEAHRVCLSVDSSFQVALVVEVLLREFSLKNRPSYPISQFERLVEKHYQLL